MAGRFGMDLVDTNVLSVTMPPQTLQKLRRFRAEWLMSHWWAWKNTIFLVGEVEVARFVCSDEISRGRWNAAILRGVERDADRAPETRRLHSGVHGDLE